MQNFYRIEKAKRFTQRDNIYAPYISCFPTSLGMGIDYCLSTVGLSKTDIGCSEKMQVEDYINQCLDDPTTTTWMRTNTGKIGNWIWNYNRRTIFAVEEYVFNRLMNTVGFKATFLGNLTYDMYCMMMEHNELPIILGGNFAAVSAVGGHMVCGVGFSRLGVPEVIVHDPYGNALKGYKNDSDGEFAHYGLRFFLTDNKTGFMNAVVLERI
jgi:hypothetical protein